MFLKWFIPCLIAAVVIGLLIFSLTWKKNKFTTKDLALAAVCIGMSFALSYIKFWPMPQGGSITAASMLPIMLFAYIVGFRKGLIAGIAYGFLQIIQDPQVYHPVQVLLDYIMGFGAVCLAGVFKNIKELKYFDFLLGIAVVGVTRFLCSLISGVVFFAEYAGGQNVWIYSATYNSVLLIDIAICLAVAVLMQFSPHFRKFMNYMDDGSNFKIRKKKEEIIVEDATLATNATNGDGGHLSADICDCGQILPSPFVDNNDEV